MNRSIFNPGAGSVIQRFTAAVAEGAMYPGDWVALSITAATSQGVTAGQHRSKTLGADDFIECELTDTGVAGSEGLVLGVVMGKGIHSVSDWTNVTSEVLADGDVAIIQNYGVHPCGRQATGGNIGDWLAVSSVAGECTNGTTAALQDPGVALEATAAYTRATASDEHSSAVFIRCG